MNIPSTWKSEGEHSGDACQTECKFFQLVYIWSKYHLIIFQCWLLSNFSFILVPWMQNLIWLYLSTKNVHFDVQTSTIQMCAVFLQTIFTRVINLSAILTKEIFWKLKYLCFLSFCHVLDSFRTTVNFRLERSLQSSQLLFQVKLNKFNPSYNIRSHCLCVRSFQKARFPHLTSPGMSCILIQFIM